MNLKTLFIAAGLAMFFSPLLAQIETTPANINTSGFFTDNGNKKLEAMDCYGFKDLLVSFRRDVGYYKYSQFRVSVVVGGGLMGTKRFQIIEDESVVMSASKGRDYIFFPIFSTEDMTEKSEFSSANKYSIKRMKRSSLACTSNKKALEANLTGRLYGRLLVTVYPEEYKWVELESFTIPMSNRTKVGNGAKKPDPEYDPNCLK